MICENCLISWLVACCHTTAGLRYACHSDNRQPQIAELSSELIPSSNVLLKTVVVAWLFNQYISRFFRNPQVACVYKNLSLEHTHSQIKPVHIYVLVIQVLSYSTNVLCAFLISVRAESLAGLLSVFQLIFWKLLMSLNAEKKEPLIRGNLLWCFYGCSMTRHIGTGLVWVDKMLALN